MLEPWNDMAEAQVFLSTDDGIKLLGMKCRQCERIDFPATGFCRYCLSDELERQVIPSTGVLYASTTVHTADPAYSVGYVDLPIGLRVFGHVSGDAVIGDRMHVISVESPVTFARIGEYDD